MSISLKQQLWRAVNGAVLPRAKSLVKSFKSMSAGAEAPEEQLPALADLSERADLAIACAKPDQPPPLDAATLACFNSFDKVFLGIRLKFFLYLLLNATLAILAIGLLVVGGVFLFLGARDNVEYLKTILGSISAISGLAGTLYTNPVKMVFKAAMLSSQVNLLCQRYQLEIKGCKANRNLADNTVLQEAINCVARLVDTMLTQLGVLADRYDK